MTVSNQSLLDKIGEWEEELVDNTKHIHFALLEVFIEFEKFFKDAFILYSLGKKGKNNFSPKLRIEFEDEEHLLGFLKCDKQYVDYIKKITEIKEYIFLQGTCPFKKVFDTSKFQTYFKQIQLLRNFIAHQSEESKRKYIEKVLRTNGQNSYIKANTFLNKINRNKNVSYYSIYIDAMKFYSEIICDAT